MAQQQNRQQDAELAALAALVAAQAAARANLSRQAVRMAVAAARKFSGWYKPAEVTAWSAKLAADIEALQKAQARTTDAYLSHALSDIVGGRVRPAGAISVADLRANITHAGAYARAADTFRWQQAQFDRYAQTFIDTPAADLAKLTPPELVSPLEAAVQRVADVADTDMQLADRAQAAQVLQDNAERHDIRGYRRVIHPELSKGGTCGLCIAASDRVYHVSDLKAIHHRCECTVLPIVGQKDPGSGLNNLDLGDLYEHAGGGTGGKGLKRTRYQINEHGELGPVLTDGTFRTPRAVKRAERNRQPRTDAQRRAAMEQIRSRLDKALPVARDLEQSDPTRWGGYVQNLEARISDLDAQLSAADAA